LAGWRSKIPRLGYRKRVGHFLVNLARGLPCVMRAPHWRRGGGLGTRQPASEAQEAFFAHGWDVKDAWSKAGANAG